MKGALHKMMKISHNPLSNWFQIVILLIIFIAGGVNEINFIKIGIEWFQNYVEKGQKVK